MSSSSLESSPPNKETHGRIITRWFRATRNRPGTPSHKGIQETGGLVGSVPKNTRRAARSQSAVSFTLWNRQFHVAARTNAPRGVTRDHDAFVAPFHRHEIHAYTVAGNFASERNVGLIGFYWNGTTVRDVTWRDVKNRAHVFSPLAKLVIYLQIDCLDVLFGTVETRLCQIEQ